MLMLIQQGDPGVTQPGGPAAGQSFYITTAINYTNGNPHIGHAYEVIYKRMYAREANRSIHRSIDWLTDRYNSEQQPPNTNHKRTKAVTSDMIARYQRVYGRKVFFLTGTDEHGQKVAATAEVGTPSWVATRMMEWL